MPGVSSPKYHSTELVADFREDPVPTTSPTNATGRPFSLIASICFRARNARRIGFNAVPGHFEHGQACSGISGRDQASGAGERSSVLVSPVTLKTTIFKDSGTSGRSVNHSPAAQLSNTAWALLTPFCQLYYVMEGVEHEQRLFSSLAAWRPAPHRRAIRPAWRCCSHHACRPAAGWHARDQSDAAGLSLRQRRQKAGFDVGGLINPGGHARSAVQQEGLLTRRWALSSPPSRQPAQAKAGQGVCSGRRGQRRVGDRLPAFTASFYMQGFHGRL